MKSMARRRLSGLARLSLALIVALTLAAPYSGANAHAMENTLGNTSFDPIAYSSDAKAASPSLEEAKAALDSANQIKADAAANKEEAKKAYDSATAAYNTAASEHEDAKKAADAAKAEADKAIDGAKEEAEKRVQNAHNSLSVA